MKKHVTLSELKKVDIKHIDKQDLHDVSDFAFDTTVPQEQRAERVIAAVKNPYCFRVKDLGVKLEFSEGAPTLQELFTDFLKRKRSGL